MRLLRTPFVVLGFVLALALAPAGCSCDGGPPGGYGGATATPATASTRRPGRRRHLHRRLAVR
ncbi:MAG: hypothetical protein HS111_19465 [Kofleriaceae bacterium]|nr:hypothetical protein [Kofleriaceae bacterium]